MEKLNIPDWAGDDWTPESGQDIKDTETMLVLTMKKLNEIIDWINSQ
tara:strand:+ start:978 stop:1118 length:141 start_codon:yes stop_codon:yes gene_type:complete